MPYTCGFSLPVCPSVCVPLCESVCMYVCMYVYTFFYLSVCQSVSPSLWLSGSLSRSLPPFSSLTHSPHPHPILCIVGARKVVHICKHHLTRFTFFSHNLVFVSCLLLNIINSFVVHARVPAAVTTTSRPQPTTAATTLPPSTPKKTNGSNMAWLA